MPSAKIIRFPRPRRRPVPPPAPVRYASRPYPRRDAGGFVVLCALTFPAAFCYLSGAVDVARRDTLYAALLSAVWGFYFLHPPLLRIRVLGPLLVLAGRLLLIAGVFAFFGMVYWVILTPHD
jgi:hypothetical protein